MNFVDMIFFYARATPEKPAIILADRIVTYRMMAAGIRSVESVLQDLGLVSGQIVAVRIDNPARHIIITCALYHLGITTISVTPKTNAAEGGVRLDAMITDGAPVGWTGRILVADDDWFIQEKPATIHTGTGFADPHALCRIAFSSGTTAAARPIGISARVFEDHIETYNRVLSFAPWDRILILQTLTAILGSVAMALSFGRTLVFASSALETMQLINLYSVDVLIANPQHLKDLVAAHQTNPIPTPSLKAIRFSGAALATALISEVRTRFCNKIICLFVSTESGPIAFAPIDRLLHVPGASGYLAPWAELEAIGENGDVLPLGSEGILRVRTRAQGRDLSQAPTSDTEPQWNYSGDYGKLMPDGMVVLSGRVSDMIKLPGKLIFPEPVEQALASYPGIEEAAALGRPDAAGQHEFWIAIKADGPIDIEGVKHFLSRQDPRWIVTGVMLVDAMPRNERGKLVRQQLRERLPAH